MPWIKELHSIAVIRAAKEYRIEARLSLLKELEEQWQVLERHYRIIRALRGVTRPVGVTIPVPD